ncbi:type VI secretion system protein ImpG [Vibrio nigripulchritudo]|uniref:type VI secretion system baseplate subunit TssF n=1 Tax=Vibrio nigripulchritudo TaxID=28173 RepID=UPI00190D3E47|nr:type VI secretion system baseplate subunit TssF [Vibrio nigripulchritudo]BCL70002.1 type VI secretion system protein ImpG [Vibrio nigripulchritudo]BDU31352.1 type VI secretion system protein ImpG [Vibrio nigripulchritudo]
MSDEFLKYYNRELAYLRHKGQEFGATYPKIAARLKLSEEQVEDPHVARIMEGCAFLTAQIRQSLDNSFPQLTEALIGQLFPDFHAPIPSMSVVKIDSDESATSKVTVKKGESVTFDAPGFKSCQFRTCYETDVLPLNISEASFENAPFRGQLLDIEKEAKSVLKLTLKGASKEIEINGLNFDSLRLFFNGQPQVTYKLLQFFLQSAIGMAVVVDDETRRQLTPRHIKPVGYEAEHSVVPYSKRSFVGSRLLVEYFLFPEKFLFADLLNLESAWFGDQDEAEFWIYFDQSCDWLEKQVTKDTVLLGCTPVINMFSHAMEPTRIVASEYEFPLYPEHLEPDTTEVIGIQEIGVRSWQMKYQSLPPFYAGEHTNYLSEHEIYWTMRREDKSWAGGFDEPGRDVYVSFVDKEHKLFTPDSKDNWVMSAQAWCCNRNLPKKLPFGGGMPNVNLPDVKDNFDSTKCLVAPTETIRPSMDASSRWQFAKLLTLSHFSGSDGLKTLRETLNLYAFKASPESKAMIDSIVSMDAKPATGRVNQKGRVGFCHGTEITLEVSDSAQSEEQIFFLGNVLSTFFAQYAEINTFTKLCIRLKSSGDVFHCWPALCGDKVLL